MKFYIYFSISSQFGVWKNIKKYVVIFIKIRKRKLHYCKKDYTSYYNNKLDHARILEMRLENNWLARLINQIKFTPFIPKKSKQLLDIYFFVCFLNFNLKKIMRNNFKKNLLASIILSYIFSKMLRHYGDYEEKTYTAIGRLKCIDI